MAALCVCERSGGRNSSLSPLFRGWYWPDKLVSGMLLAVSPCSLEAVPVQNWGNLQDKTWEEIRFQLLNKITIQCHVLGSSDVSGDIKVLNSLW